MESANRTAEALEIERLTKSLAQFNLLMSIIDPKINLKATENYKGYTSVETPATLKTHLKKCPNTTKLIYLGDPSGIMEGSISYYKIIYRHPALAHIYIMLGTFMLNQDPIINPILITGTMSLMRNLLSIIRSLNLQFDIMPAPLVAELSVYRFEAGHTNILHQNEHVLYQCEETTLYSLLADRSIPWTNRTMSCLLYLYPYVGTYCEKKYNIIGEDNFYPLNVGSRSVNETDDPQAKSQRAMALIGIHLLGPAYTQRDSIARQIRGRLSAACASRNLDCPTEETIKEQITELDWVAGGSAPGVDGLFGRVIAVNENGEYDPRITMSALIDPIRLQEQHGLSDFAIVMLEQLRMVYSRFRASSINMARAVYQHVKVPYSALLGDWKQEITNFQKVSDEIGDSPYTGLVEILPERLRISGYPKLVAAGVEYYESQLHTAEDKQLFAKYNKTTIHAKVGSPSDLTTINAIVKLIPPPSIQTLALLIRTSTIEEAEKLILNLSEEDVNKIIGLLDREGEPGPWLMSKRIEEESKELVKITQSAKEILSARIAQKYSKYRDDADQLENRTQRRMAFKIVNDWKENLLDAINNWTPIERLIISSSSIRLRHIRTEILAQAKLIQDALMIPPILPDIPMQTGDD